MGQKVSPTGFRLGITEEWRSRWYADKDYAQNLANDLAIRKFLDKQLARAAVSKVEIERAGDKIKVIVTTARPGVGIGTKTFEQANCDRAFLGETADETNGEIVELVCNIDDMTPEALAFASARLLDLGALDGLSLIHI